MELKKMREMSEAELNAEPVSYTHLHLLKIQRGKARRDTERQRAPPDIIIAMPAGLQT